LQTGDKLLTLEPRQDKPPPPDPVMGPRPPPLSSSQKPRLTEAEAAQVMRQLVEQQRQLKAQLQYHSLQVTAAGERGGEGVGAPPPRGIILVAPTTP